jgi:hypothetical protein
VLSCYPRRTVAADVFGPQKLGLPVRTSSSLFSSINLPSSTHSQMSWWGYAAPGLLRFRSPSVTRFDANTAPAEDFSLAAAFARLARSLRTAGSAHDCRSERARLETLLMPISRLSEPTEALRTPTHDTITTYRSSSQTGSVR